MTPLIGRNVGSYRVLAKTQLGESGFVYKSLHMAKRQTFALKLLRGALTVESPLQRQFLDKLRIAETLDHPSIARTYPIESAEESFDRPSGVCVWAECFREDSRGSFHC